VINKFRISQALILAFIVILILPEVKESFKAWGITWTYIALLSSCITYTLIPAVAEIATRLGAVDQPGGRHAHTVTTPLMGGAAIFLGFALVMVFARDILFFSLELKAVAFAASLIFISEALDDIWGLSASIRLAIQFLAVAILIKYGVILSFLPQTWWGDAGEILITTLWVIGITNAVNFLDGMDGLASGSSAINAAFFALVALQTGQPFMMLLSIALMGGCLGFLPYNFRRLKPASIFLGDSGSNFLGFTLAGIGILGEWGTNNLVGLAVPILILSVPIFDTTLTTVVRIKTGKVRSFGEWIKFAGRDHFHHRLSDLGLGNKTAVWIIYLISVWLGLEALVTKNARGIDAVFSLLQVFIVFVLIGSFMVFVQNRYERLAQVRRAGTRD
jgi:UDP-GlcNAc:undecaprenyl-phosphate GlcNAc-1-phosphate transferase